MGRWFGVIWIWGSLAFAGAAPSDPDPLAGNLLRSRPCAGILAAFLEAHPSISGQRRVTLESIQQSAKASIYRFLQEELHRGYHFQADGNFLLSSDQLGFFNRETITARMASLHGSIEYPRTLVGVFDGETRITQFLDRFRDKTQAFVSACRSPAHYRESLLSSHLAQAFLIGGLTVGATQFALGQHHALAWGLGALALVRGATMNCDFSFLFDAMRDGTTAANARLPTLFEKATRIARAEATAPRWLAWGTSLRFSVDTMKELWESSYGDWVSPTLASAIDLDDEINTMPFWERWRTARAAARLKKKSPTDYTILQRQTQGPPLLIDFILLKGGTAGLRHPRLIVAFRLPPFINEDERGDGGGGGGGSPPFSPVTSDPGSHRTPELVH